MLIGDYKTEAIANKALEDVKKAGYPDAFVTKRKLDAKASTTTKPTDTPKGKDEAKPTDEKPADTDKYLIQLGLIKDADFTQYGNLTDLGTIYSEKNGDTFRVSLGVFTGREAANKVLETVKKRGYATAFPRKRDAPKKYDKLLIYTKTQTISIICYSMACKLKQAYFLSTQKLQITQWINLPIYIK